MREGAGSCGKLREGAGRCGNVREAGLKPVLFSCEKPGKPQTCQNNPWHPQCTQTVLHSAENQENTNKRVKTTPGTRNVLKQCYILLKTKTIQKCVKQHRPPHTNTPHQTSTHVMHTPSARTFLRQTRDPARQEILVVIIWISMRDCECPIQQSLQIMRPKRLLWIDVI